MSAQTITDPAYYTATMSVAEWKRVPTLWQVFFGVELPYRPPKSAVGKFFWRRRVWVEVTFALSMLQAWEKVLVLVLMYALLTLLATAVFLYFPHHLAFIQRRTAYYLFGRDELGLTDMVKTGVTGVASGASKVFAGLGWNASGGIPAEL